MDHLIKLDKLFNTRDLGGYVNKDGKTLKNKKLIRSGSLFKATENDINKLFNEYNLRTVIDFRNDLEIKGEPDRIHKNIKYIKNTVLKEEENGVTFPERKESLEERMKSLYDYLKLLGNNPEENVIKLYKKFLLDEECIEAYKKFFDILLDTKDGAILFHCSAGKDRAGLATALILLALDFDKDLIINDYMKTNEYIFEYGYNKTLKDFESLNYDLNEIQLPLKSLFSVNKKYIDVLFNFIETNFANYKEFLNKLYSLDEVKINILKERFLEDGR